MEDYGMEMDGYDDQMMDMGDGQMMDEFGEEDESINFDDTYQVSAILEAIIHDVRTMVALANR